MNFRFVLVMWQSPKAEKESIKSIKREKMRKGRKKSRCERSIIEFQIRTTEHVTETTATTTLLIVLETFLSMHIVNLTLLFI